MEMRWEERDYDTVRVVKMSSWLQRDESGANHMNSKRREFYKVAR